MPGVDVGTAYLTVVPSFSGFGSKVTSELTSGSGSMVTAGEEVGKKTGGGFTKGFKAVAATAAAAGAVSFLKGSVDAAKEAEQSQTQLADAFTKFPKLADTSQQALQGLNEGLMNKTRFDDDALASGQATLAQFDLTGKQIEQLTPLLADYAAKTGTDLPTAAEQLGKAMLGNGKALKSVGIDFKDAGSVGANFDQVMSGLNEKVAGFGEKDGKTAAGQAEILANQFGEIQEQVGGALLPVLQTLGEKLLIVVGFIRENSTWLGPLAGIILGVVGAIKVWTIVQAALNTVMALNPIGIIVIAIGALVAALIYAYQNSETFRDIVNGAFEAVGNVVRTVYNNVIQPALQFFLEMIANIMRSFGDFLIMLGNVPGFGWAKEAGENIKGAADQVTLLSDKIQKIPDKTVTITVDVDKAFKGEVDGVIAGVAARAGRNASGTPYWKGGLTWVGEEGPELLNLPRGSQILSNEDSRALVASQASVFQPTVSPAAVKGEPMVQQNFHGPIVAHDYDDFQRKMADQRRLGALAGRRA
jgi:uncharacterized membrane protein YeaQ/YmgE (transglycosylase-associated protein family)